MIPPYRFNCLLAVVVALAGCTSPTPRHELQANSSLGIGPVVPHDTLNCHFYNHPQTLEDKETIIDVELVQGAHGACWMLLSDFLKMPVIEDDTNYLQQKFIEVHTFYLEEDTTAFTSKDESEPLYHYHSEFYFVLRLTGRFYKEKGFPWQYSNKEDSEPARVFKYRTIKVLWAGDDARKLRTLK